MAQNSGHDAPWLTNTQTEKCFQFGLKTREVHVLSVVWCGGKLFHTRGPAALKLRSLKLLCVYGTKHDEDDDDDHFDDFRSAGGS